MADADRAARVGGALQPVGVAAPPARQRLAAFVRVARPISSVAGLLLVEVLGNPRSRAAALGLARSLGRRLTAGRVPTRAVAASRATACRVTVVEEPAATTMLVRRVETALTIPVPGEPPGRRAPRGLRLGAR
jgi:hypothetical protein